MTTLTLSTADPSNIQADAVVVLVASGRPGGANRPTKRTAPPRPLAGAERIDAAFDGRLATVLAQLGATGAVGEFTRLASLGAVTAPVILAVGVGTGEPDPETLRRAAAVATRALKGARSVVLSFPPLDAAAVAATVEGAMLGGYDFTSFRHATLEGRRPAVGKVILVVADKKPATRQAVTRGQVLAAAVALCRDLVNTPPNELPPSRLADLAAAAAREAGVEVEVLDEVALAAAGYGGILGVGQGSTRPPRLVRLRYAPAQPRAHVALVGKGITFDSGGLSLKPGPSMETMKSDMAGAASVLAAVVAAARLDLPVAVTGWLSIAENMPSGTAIRPGDVLTMYGGRRVEVLNTDAEGRLVLADALVRAGEDNPDAVIDIATLTGAQVVALGNRVAGLMSNDDDFRATVTEAAKVAGEAFWPMPLPPELREKLDSPVADLANVGANGNREGGMLVAGLFLREFVSDELRWAHLDIAGPSWNGGEPYGHTTQGGTGFGIRTLLAIIEAHAA